VSQARVDSEDLMNAALPFAHQMLREHGAFLPFGAAMRPDDEIVSIASYDGNDCPDARELIRLIKDGFIAGARAKEYKATALVYDVRVKLPASGEASDAIAVSLNHRDGYSIVVLFPYRLEKGELREGTAYAQVGEADIFTPGGSALQ
jgi:hypothetical protein